MMMMLMMMALSLLKHISSKEALNQNSFHTLHFAEYATIENSYLISRQIICEMKCSKLLFTFHSPSQADISSHQNI